MPDCVTEIMINLLEDVRLFLIAHAKKHWEKESDSDVISDTLGTMFGNL